MDIRYNKPLQKNSTVILRAAGYIPLFDRQSGKESYALKIRGDRYPRFHLYVKEESDSGVWWHVHLDQKEHGWSESRHDTEYDGEEVKKEGERLVRWLAHYTRRL
jgi:hypothetical protein